MFWPGLIGAESQVELARRILRSSRIASAVCSGGAGSVTGRCCWLVPAAGTLAGSSSPFTGGALSIRKSRTWQLVCCSFCCNRAKQPFVCEEYITECPFILQAG